MSRQELYRGEPNHSGLYRTASCRVVSHRRPLDQDANHRRVPYPNEVRSSRRRRHLVCSWVLLLLVLGCGPNDSSRSAQRTAPQRIAPQRTSETRISSDAPAAPDIISDATPSRFVRLSSVGDATPSHLESEVALADQPSEAWESERFAERTTQQLKEVASWLSGAPGKAEANDDRIRSILTPDFSYRLDSSSDVTVQLARHRIESQSESPVSRQSIPSRSGDDRGLQSLQRLLEGIKLDPTSSAEHALHDNALHIAVKTYRVSPDVTPPKSRALVHVSSHIDGQSIERMAVWDCTWTVPTTGLPRLRSVEQSGLQTVKSKEDETLFVDVAPYVLGETECYVSQFTHGVDHWRHRLDWRHGLDLIGPHGLAVGDLNGDGLDDLYVCEPGGLPNRLFIQQSDGTANELAGSAGLDYLEPTQSALVLDLDNDGDQDVVIASGRYLLAFENEGRLQFRRRLIHESDAMIRSMAAADYDDNRFLDIYVCGYFGRSANTGIGLGRPVPYHDANNGVANYLMSNQGGFQFRDVTESVGLEMNNRRFSYACAWCDYDNDGDADLYVANDFGRNNLYENLGGKFRDVAAHALVEDVSAGMSVAWGDYDRDGRWDVYVGNMFSSAGNRISYQRAFVPRADSESRELLQRHARGNSLFRNLDGRQFNDVSIDAGVTIGRWAWSSNFVDLNNDGWQDLVVANGMVTNESDQRDL